MAKDYQADGFVSGLNSKSLAEANRQIHSAMLGIPITFRDKYKSQIRSIRKGDFGYAWYVVLK